MFKVKVVELDMAEIILSGHYPYYKPTRTLSLVDNSTYMNENFQPVNDSHMILYVDDLTLPRPGYTLPEMSHVEKGLAHFDGLTDVDCVLIHCHAGVSRSAAMAVLLYVKYGVPPADAITKVYVDRDCIWPNDLIIEMGDQLLGCNGELVDAMREWKHWKRGVSFVPNIYKKP